MSSFLLFSPALFSDYFVLLADAHQHHVHIVCVSKEYTTCWFQIVTSRYFWFSCLFLLLSVGVYFFRMCWFMSGPFLLLANLKRSVEEDPPDFRNVGTGKLVCEMGFTCLAFAPSLLGNRLLQPVLRGAEPSPGAFAVRDHGRRVPFVACVAEVAVPTRVVVFAPVFPVLGVFRTDFVRWADWTVMVSDRPGDRAVKTVVDLRRRGGGD